MRDRPNPLTRICSSGRSGVYTIIARSNAIRNKWYLAKENGYLGPFTLEELRVKLAAHPNSAEVLLWCHHFSHWKRASDVDDPLPLVQSTPPSPHSSGAA